MGAEKNSWLGPGETARRLGVTTKALKVYEREGLVAPHRVESGWRLYGPVQIARLHQIIVLRDLGLSLQSIKKLIGSQSRLREILRLQLESLEEQRNKIGWAIELIKTAQRQLDEGRDLSLDDLATLTRETVVQQPIDLKEFENRLKARVSEADPTGQSNQIIDQLKAYLLSTRSEKEFEDESKAIKAELSRLKDAGDMNSEAAKQVARRWRSLTANLTANVKLPTKAQGDLIRNAYAEVLSEANTKSEPLAFDMATLEFLGQIMKGMKERGDLT